MTKRKDGPSAGAKLRVMKRDCFRCTYCGASGNDVELQVDHIIPMSKGGSSHLSNLTTACAKCNNTKNDRLAWGWSMDRKDSESSQHGKDGMVFIHFMKNGRIHQQGTSYERNESFWLVQRYSMLTGDPTDIVAVKIDDVLNEEKIRMYSTKEEWITAAVKQSEKDGTLKGSVESNVAGQMALS